MENWRLFISQLILGMPFINHDTTRPGGLGQAIAFFILQTRDLIELGRNSYGHADILARWNRSISVDNGLFPREETILERIPGEAGGRILVMGSGGGRDSIALGKQGFQVVCIDFVPEMVQSAVQNASDRGVCIMGVTQEFSQLGFVEGSFEKVWLTDAMYSSLPTKPLRKQMLCDILSLLRPGGFFVAEIHWGNRSRVQDGRFTWMAEKVGIVIAHLIRGFTVYERGDGFWKDCKEFVHTFTNKEAVIDEFESVGFSVVEPVEIFNKYRGFVVAQKPV